MTPVSVALVGCASTAESATPTATSPPDTPGNEDGLADALRKLEQSYHGRIGAFALDTANGAAVSYRPDERFPLCSTFKVLASSAVLRKARESEHGLMDRVIHYSDGDLVPYSPVTKKHVATGMSVAHLCKAAITMSDNTAGNLLLHQIGGPSGVTGFARSLGDDLTRLDRWEIDLNRWHPGQQRDTTTPGAMGADLRAVALGDALHPEDSRQLCAWLRANTTGAARIQAGLPSDWTVGDKTGTGLSYATATDIGVAWPPQGAPIVLAIYTNREGKNAEAKDSVIAETAAHLVRALGRTA